ncbi:hypothetical protein F4703DRAFT_1831240 [Phycomyces blakesleeanus]
MGIKQFFDIGWLHCIALLTNVSQPHACVGHSLTYALYIQNYLHNYLSGLICTKEEQELKDEEQPGYQCNYYSR